MRTTRATSRRAGALTIALLAGIMAAPAVILLSAAPSAADSARVSTGTRIAAETQPGVQLIQTTFSASLSVPVPDINQAAMNNLTAQLTSQVASGVIGADQTSIANAIVTAIDNDPLAYLTPTSQVQTKDSQIVGFGTGWVVTPDGFMVTASHVVDPGKDELTTAFAKDALTDFDNQDAQQLAQSAGASLNSDQLAKLDDAAAKYNAHSLSISNIKTTVVAQLGTAVTGLGKGQVGKTVEVLSKGDPYPGKDVAILKVEGQTNMPTIRLGSDADVNEGDILYVDGYPASSTFESGTSSDSVQTTQTEGPLTAKKNANDSSMPIFQIQAPVSPGSSGSPVLDSNGNAVGMAVAVAVDQSGAQVPGQSFAIPISIVREKLNQQNIHPAQSLTTSTYAKALDGYFLHYYKRALPLFQQVKNLYPDQPYVGDYISRSQTAIAQGKDQTPHSSFPWVIVIIGVAVLVIAAVAVVLITVPSKRRRRRGEPGPAGPDTPPWPTPGNEAQPPAAQPEAPGFAPPAAPPAAPQPAPAPQPAAQDPTPAQPLPAQPR